jgi:hypothetical protein
MGLTVKVSKTRNVARDAEASAPAEARRDDPAARHLE